MKKFLLLFCLLFTTAFSGENEKTMIMSYQRCGTHWLGYCLYQLLENYDFDYTDQYRDISPFMEPMRTKNPHGKKMVRGHYLVNKYSHQKTTKRFNVIYYDRKKDVLIVLLRDYRECYIRNNLKRQCKNPLELMRVDPTYFDNLEIYHTWPEERRYIVYYEDLLENMHDTLKDLLAFLGEKGERLDPFIDEIDAHRQVVLKAYDRKWSSVTKGEDLHYHKEQTDPMILEGMDQIVLKKYPHLLPYLERYLPN